MGLGSWRWLTQQELGEAQAPQARGMHGLRRHVEYLTVADAVIESYTLDLNPARMPEPVDGFERRTPPLSRSWKRERGTSGRCKLSAAAVC
jgi:hypothetical protein